VAKFYCNAALISVNAGIGDSFEREIKPVFDLWCLIMVHGDPLPDARFTNCGAPV
jgi:hypothetical protein